MSQVELLPLDAAILERLPRQGAKMGYHNLAATMNHLAREWRDEEVTSAQLNGCIRKLKLAGLAVSVKVQPLNRGLGWQITPEGEQALSAYRAAQNGSESA